MHCTGHEYIAAREAAVVRAGRRVCCATGQLCEGLLVRRVNCAKGIEDDEGYTTCFCREYVD